MVFSSAIFVFCFLPVTLGLYYIANKTGSIRVRNAVLLCCSLAFYAWGGVRPLLVLIIIILVNWCFVLLMQKFVHMKAALLAVVLCVNVINLIYFKNLQYIGVSFYTFQIISYVVDAYRGEVAVQRNVFKLALYVTLFPQLIAGPIVRYRDVNLEIDARSSNLAEVEQGIKRFIIGFAKKVFLANAMGKMADTAFAGYENLNMAYAWLGAVCYAFQIFYDFSAYSDMAIGLGWIFGFHFNENFNYPYISQSIKEFWRRWHISLSSWFRDYVYIPLGGNRKGKIRTYINLFIVFLLTGVWHGVAWQFVVWGMYHGFFLIIERIGFGRILEKLPRVVRHIYTVLVVAVGWVFFRADNLSLAAAYLSKMFSFNMGAFKNAEIVLQMDKMFVVCFLISLLCVAPIIRKFAANKIIARPNVSRVLYMILWFVSVTYMIGLSYNPFIYFRF